MKPPPNVIAKMLRNRRLLKTRLAELYEFSEFRGVYQRKLNISDAAYEENGQDCDELLEAIGMIEGALTDAGVPPSDWD